MARDLPPLEGYEALIVTSSHAILALTTAGSKPSARCYCVGDATTRLALQSGLDAQMAGLTAQELAETLKWKKPDGPVLYLRGRHVAFDLLGTLHEAGMMVDEAIVYDQLDCPLTPAAVALLGAANPVIVPIFSARSAKLFLDECPEDATIHVVAISQSVADLVPLARRTGLTIASAPNASSMAAAVLNVAQSVNRLERGQ